MAKQNYVVPNTCDGVNVDVIYDGGANKLCIGKGVSDAGKAFVYVRWNGDNDKPAGFPLGSFGKSSWFSFPLDDDLEIAKLIEEFILAKAESRLKK